jgi:hypothetical protein
MTTMRWSAGNDGISSGTRLRYGSPTGPQTVRFELRPEDDGWRVCELGAAGEDVHCWGVAQGDGGTLDGGRAFIDLHGDRLRIAVLGDGPEQLIFSGRRDGCD